MEFWRLYLGFEMSFGQRMTIILLQFQEKQQIADTIELMKYKNLNKENVGQNWPLNSKMEESYKLVEFHKKREKWAIKTITHYIAYIFHQKYRSPCVKMGMARVWSKKIGNAHFLEIGRRRRKKCVWSDDNLTLLWKKSQTDEMVHIFTYYILYLIFLYVIFWIFLCLCLFLF